MEPLLACRPIAIEEHCATDALGAAFRASVKRSASNWSSDSPDVDPERAMFEAGESRIRDMDPSLLTALQTFGADRIIFSVDYPLASNEQSPRVLRQRITVPGGPCEDLVPECDQAT